VESVTTGSGATLDVPADDPGFILRRSRTDESDAIAALWLHARAAAVPSIPRPVHTDDEVRQWFATIVLPTSEVWVIEHEDRLVALMVLHDGWIDQLYVDPPSARLGLGSGLLDLAKELNPQGLDLWTFQANTGARRFYERHGFVAVASTDGDNEERAPDVRYRWPGAGR
jgi:GNAT superfamily N-acetyltransferase